jgi:hypothetical protein
VVPFPSNHLDQYCVVRNNIVMAAQKRRKWKEVSKPVPEKPENGKPDVDQSDKDEKMDFGGLPARDLKKSLGCG